MTANLNSRIARLGAAVEALEALGTDEALGFARLLRAESIRLFGLLMA